MNFTERIILIDSNLRRRAAISHTLSASAIHVEPFERIAELAQAWPRSGIIMVEDAPGTITGLNEAMGRHGDWFPVIAFGESPPASRIVQAVLDGALDYLSWPVAAEELASALIRVTLRGETVGSGKQREVIARARVGRLTPREREVLGGVAEGLSNRLIGQKLAISPRTVEIHRANMLNKLGAAHTSEAIRIAVEADLVGRV